MSLFCFWFLNTIIICFFLFVLLVVSFMVFNFNVFYMNKNMFIYYLLFLIIFILSMGFLVYSKNFVVLFFCWDMLGLSSFFLILFFSNWDSFNNSFFTMFINRIGDLFLLVVVVFSFVGGLFFSGWLLVLASMTKSAVFPFMTWLPKAMSAPTPISSLVHSSTLVTAGFFLLMNYFLFNYLLILFLFYFSLLTLFFSGVLSIFEMDFKKMVALSTMSQISFCIFLFTINFWIFSFIHICSHSFFKSSLFVQSGYFMFLNFSEQNKHKLILLKSFLNLRFLFLVFCLMGLSFNVGLMSKDFLLEMFLDFSWSFFNIVFLLTLFFTFFYSFLLLMTMFNMNKESSFLNFKLCFFVSNFLLIFSLMNNWLMSFNMKLFVFVTELFLPYFILSIFMVFIMIFYFNLMLKFIYKNVYIILMLKLEFLLLFYQMKIKLGFLLSFFLVFMELFEKLFFYFNVLIMNLNLMNFQNYLTKWGFFWIFLLIII